MEKLRTFTIPDDANLIAICHDCGQMLYAAEEANTITHLVADSACNNHSNSFSNPHRTDVVALGDDLSTIPAYELPIPPTLWPLGTWRI